MRPRWFALAASLTALLSACGDTSQLAPEAAVGPTPTLPEPTETLIPTVKVASAIGWSGNAKPKAADGLSVTPFATGLSHPRWFLVLPNGDVLVAETDGPERPDDAGGIK